MSEIVLGVCGGVAAYKAALLTRLFTEAGHGVAVVPTESALEFVGRATWEALSGRPVQTGVFENVHEVPHVRLGQHADLVVVAPATANTLAKAAAGMADDLVTNTLLTARCPVLMAPAMHTEMWEHAATQANVVTLRERGVTVVDPAVGRLTGSDTGAGRLPDPEQIYAVALALLAGHPRDLVGRHVVVTAGGTREYLDPVRFLGNRSSGLQGVALAEAAVARGASVTLIAANVAVSTPAGVELVEVVSTEELRVAATEAARSADAVVMAAAPADFRPVARSDAKIKKRADGQAPTIELVENPDILVELVGQRTGESPVIVGFAAETGDGNGSVLDHARAKLARKGCELLVVNDVSAGKVFGREDNEAVLLSSDGSAQEVPLAHKSVLAHAIWERVATLLSEDRNS
ncbi:MAG: bifunctional phosphopantothenoylcysteine decarboxylase/phosphopantothenate--cysteine ligase CoaBC [Aeromicrobium sp.]|uniref:bifunctional phosphopantothenoylcysteine decarboxylase/phosphopantothenate--cysteine ligase CoaBC n=1 Tax=Aeromicrobium sp. TaxID=1871063 RepID=UPI0039E24A64